MTTTVGIPLGTAAARGAVATRRWFDGWAFSRDSVTTGWTYDGYLRSFPTGRKAITDLGLMVEGASANYYDNPTDFTQANWTKVNASIATGGPAGPDGVAGQYIVEDTASGEHGIQSQSVNWTTGDTKSISFILDQDTAKYFQLNASSSRFGLNAWGNFDVELGYVGSSGSALKKIGMMPVAGGQYYCWATMEATGTGAGNDFLTLVTSAGSPRSEAHDGTEERGYIQRVQVEELTYVSAPFAGTKASTEMTKAEPLPAGSWDIEFEATWLSEQNTSTKNLARLFSWSDETYDHHITILPDDENYLGLEYNEGGTTSLLYIETSADCDYGSYRPYRSVRAAVRYDDETSSLALFINGRKVYEGVVTEPTAWTTIRLGGSPDNARRSSAYWDDCRLTKRLRTDDEIVVSTTRKALAAPIVETDVDPEDGGRVYRASRMIPAICRVGTRTFYGWQDMDTLTHPSGEGPGAYVVLAYRDDGDTVSTVFAHIRPPNRYWQHTHVPHFWLRPDGELVCFFSMGGSGCVHDGYTGIWAARITDLSSAAPTVALTGRLADGEAHKPFDFDGGHYMGVEIWPSAILPTRPGLTPGKYIYQIDYDTLALTQIGVLPVGRNDTFGEAAYVELDDGTCLAHWRTTLGDQYAVSAVGDLSSWGSAQDFTAFTTCNSRAALMRSPSGRLVKVFNNSASRTNMRVALSDDEGATWPYYYTFDTRSNISYPDVTFTATGTIQITYDRERYPNAGTGARQIIEAQVVEADVVAGTASGSTVLLTVADASP
ncbi:sialidase family protein [Ancylobacter radicis]|uniref:Exo-alpha-sialidase n=1 Tax=Ancylobacter radicis TaxID=2836179 RepID=A0ABS5R5T5_9HYPH|nr:sialidase family protein [Ancylobacter radicis]MBS9476251.1 exo-alpha-sialidase [Ancylobacter radicis]